MNFYIIQIKLKIVLTFFFARFARNSIIYLPIAALTRYFIYTYS